MSVTISKNNCNQYFISIVIETEIQPKPKTNKVVGIDLGLKSFAIQSDKIEIENPKYLGESQAKMKRIQKHLSRKVKGSNRWHKLRLRLAKLHLKVANQREWFLHNYSTFLVNNYDTICIEDLNVAGMMKNHKLAGAIGDASWSRFVKMLEYKCRWYGKEMIKVDRFYASSKTCNVCGYKNEGLTLSDRAWECPQCKTLLDRDLNASINILNYGRQSSGDLTDAEVEVTKPMKRLKSQWL
jgi:putative transposase